MILPSQGILVMSGNILVVIISGVLLSEWVEVGVVLIMLQCTRQPPNQRIIWPQM